MGANSRLGAYSNKYGIQHTELDCGTSTGRVHSLHNYHLTTFFRCITLAVCRCIPANYFRVKCVRFSSCQGRYFWTFPTIFGGLPKVAENFRRCSDDLFNDDILVCCVKVKGLFELFLAILNLIFVINHVLKNSSSEFVSQAREIVLYAWHRCLKSAGVRLTYYAGELAVIYANNWLQGSCWLLSPRLVWETLWLFTIYKRIPEILVGNFRSLRTVCVVYHLPKISGLSRRARLDSSYNMKLVRNSRNL